MGLGPPAVSEEQMELPRGLLMAHGILYSSPGPASEKKLQVGHLSSALLLLFLQEESLSSGGRKNLGCSGLFFSSWIASFCSWGHRDEQGGPSTEAFLPAAALVDLLGVCQL